jgi:ABC-type bacteriocin/lantibiotic exporter with double-glycine peptidase domain
MVLEHMGMHQSYDRLRETLRITSIGTPRRNVVRLANDEIDVAYREATVSILSATLKENQPVIVFVDTGELPYWSVTTNHAVVVVGIDTTHVMVNDPAVAEAPIAVPIGDFELAWLNSDFMCAIVRQRQRQ